MLTQVRPRDHSTFKCTERRFVRTLCTYRALHSAHPAVPNEALAVELHAILTRVLIRVISSTFQHTNDVLLPCTPSFTPLFKPRGAR